MNENTVLDIIVGSIIAITITLCFVAVVALDDSKEFEKCVLKETMSVEECKELLR